jgi:hypothetical protein
MFLGGHQVISPFAHHMLGERHQSARRAIVPAANKPLKPGTKTPQSGQYLVVGPRGGKTGQEVTGVKGKTLPPTTKPGQGYLLTDATKNKSGKKG